MVQTGKGKVKPGMHSWKICGIPIDIITHLVASQVIIVVHQGILAPVRSVVRVAEQDHAALPRMTVWKSSNQFVVTIHAIQERHA